MRKTATGKGLAGSAKGSFEPKRVLAPLDFSELSGLALGRARAIVEQYGGTLVLLHVVEPIIYPVDFAVVPREMQDANLALLRNAREQLRRLKEELTMAGVRVEVEVKTGKPHSLITDLAKSKRIDLIVLPTHGRKGLKAIYLGSTAEKVVRHAPCSVLVVR